MSDANPTDNVIELRDEVLEAFAYIRARYVGDQQAPIRVRVAKAAEDRLAWQAERLAALETVNRRLRGDMANMVARLSECTCGNTHPVIDLVKHDELPSRAKPLAAAAAVRMVSENREVL